MRILRWLVTVVAGLLVLVTLVSVGYNLATSDPNVPVTKLWHGKFVLADGVLTAYRSWGSHGSPVVLVGGFLEPSFVWDAVGPLLARAGHRVYALDLDGFGYTERHGPWNLTEWTDQVQGFVRALGLGHPVVVGHSLGAAVAVREAQRGVASRIVLLDGDALPIGGPPGWLRSFFVHTPYFTTLYRFAIDSPWLVKRILKNAYGPKHPPLTNAAVKRWTDPFRAKDARQALQGLAGNGIQGVTRAQLRALRVPSLVVWGAYDTVDSVSAGRQTASDLRTRFVLVPGAGHLSMLGNPVAVAAAIR